MRATIIMTLLTWSVVAFGQEPYLLHWTEFNGLPDDDVNFCELDEQGYLWVATYNGAARFDGKKFEKFQNKGKNPSSVNANNITHIKTMSDGKVWFACYGGGVSIFDPDKRHFKHITAENDIANLHLLENRVISFTEDVNGRIYTHYRGLDAQAGGLALLDLEGNVKAHYLTEILEKYDLPIKFRVNAKDPYASDTYWLGARKLYRWNTSTEKLDTFPYPYKLDGWQDVKAILFRDSHTLTLAGLAGIYEFDRKTHVWNTLSDDVIINFASLDKENRLWLTDENGIGIFNYKTQKIDYVFTVGKETSVFDAEVEIKRFFFLDDFLWICTNKGLYAWHERFEHIKSTVIQHNEGFEFNLIRYVDSIAPEQDLYLDRNGKICIVDPQFNLIKYFPINSIVHGHSYHREKGILYVATDLGLYKWNQFTESIERFEDVFGIQGMEELDIWSVFHDEEEQTLWFGTKKNGLYKYEFQNDSLFNFRHDLNNPKSLCFDRYLFKITKGPDGNLWISTDKGISVINPITHEFIIYDSLVSKLGDKIIHHTEVDDSSNIWIGTRDHGLIRFNPLTRGFKNYTIEDGLPYTGVNRIIHADGKLIFSTRAGLCIKEDGSENITTFGIADGVINPNLYYPILNINRVNQLIFSNESSQKINLLDLDNYRHEFDSLKLNIEALHVFEDEKKIPYQGELKFIDLGPSQNYFSIDFAGINFLRPQDVRYRYKLKGHDEKWIYSGNTNNVVYTNVAGGNYEFEVQASTDSKVWTASQTMNIDLATYWYQTHLFKGAILLLIVSFVYWFYNLQMEKVRIKESYQRLVTMAELKALRSQMNPHFLFNSLNSIKSFIAENDRRNASTYLNKFSMLMRLILNHSRQETVSLNEEIKSLRLYIEMEKLRFEKLDYHITIGEDVDVETIMIQPMLIQPFVENAIWHGLLQKKGGGELKVDFNRSGEFIDVIVEDNGVGRAHAKQVKSKTSLTKKSFGMKITKERLGINNPNQKNKVNVIDLYDANGDACGTRVELRIKVVMSLESVH
ncbi:MAG: histidine kinase [Bacteroidota bacterium]